MLPCIVGQPTPEQVRFMDSRMANDQETKMKFRKTAVLMTVMGLFAFGQAYANEEAHHKAGHHFDADANHDGKVSLEEFKAANEQRMAKRFKRMDANGDGFIDATEKQAMRDKMREFHKKHLEKMHQEAGDKTS
jgi:Ca2+-binding EF-hand superfamily protein